MIVKLFHQTNSPESKTGEKSENYSNIYNIWSFLSRLFFKFCSIRSMSFDKKDGNNLLHKHNHEQLRKKNHFVYKIFIVNLSMAKIQRLGVFELPLKGISFSFYQLCIVVPRAVSAFYPVIVFVINHLDIFH